MIVGVTRITYSPNHILITKRSGNLKQHVYPHVCVCVPYRNLCLNSELVAC